MVWCCNWPRVPSKCQTNHSSSQHWEVPKHDQPSSHCVSRPQWWLNWVTLSPQGKPPATSPLKFWNFYWIYLPFIHWVLIRGSWILCLVCPVFSWNEIPTVLPLNGSPPQPTSLDLKFRSRSSAELKSQQRFCMLAHNGSPHQSRKPPDLRFRSRSSTELKPQQRFRLLVHTGSHAQPTSPDLRFKSRLHQLSWNPHNASACWSMMDPSHSRFKSTWNLCLSSITPKSFPYTHPPPHSSFPLIRAMALSDSPWFPTSTLIFLSLRSPFSSNLLPAATLPMAAPCARERESEVRSLVPLETPPSIQHSGSNCFPLRRFAPTLVWSFRGTKTNNPPS